jgi:predicted aspartyl protease
MTKKISIVPIDLVQIDEDGYHLMINAKIGRKKVRLLIDTGASKSVFDKTRLDGILSNKDNNYETLEQLSTGLGTNSMESQTTCLKSFKLGDIKIKDLDVVVLDLNHVNESYAMIGEKGIDGVIGSDLLKKYDAVIYYKGKKLKLYY